MPPLPESAPGPWSPVRRDKKPICAEPKMWQLLERAQSPSELQRNHAAMQQKVPSQPAGQIHPSASPQPHGAGVLQLRVETHAGMGRRRL